MAQQREPKVYDLEERTFVFSRSISDFVKTLPKTASNSVYIPQIIRSSSSIGANYIEANESLGPKDFLMRAKICRKEAKETIYWLRLLDVEDPERDERRRKHIDEATQLLKIFGSIVTKARLKRP
ncbi:MAG: hypothetical protein A2Z34_07195 [Planctomycetes bacterium RBG_16_59_8]|nr:MAG: hypothetical protein A2Z34_07195 [Planctomycetes bacterium RBG_16_59_8]